MKPYLTETGSPDIEAIREDVYQKFLIEVADLSEIPVGYRGLVFHVNDHGNVSLYRAFRNGNTREIWAFV